MNPKLHTAPNTGANRQRDGKHRVRKPVVFFGEVSGDVSKAPRLVLYKEVKRDSSTAMAVRLVTDVSEAYLAGFLDSVVASPDQEYEVCNGTPPHLTGAFKNRALMPRALPEARLRSVLSGSLLRPRYVPITAP